MVENMETFGKVVTKVVESMDKYGGKFGQVWESSRNVVKHMETIGKVVKQ